MEALNVNQYMLSRETSETQRLNIQHEVWKQNIGYLIHPKIASSLPASGACIADVATGSGIWLNDARSILPGDTQLVGFDISGDQFPKESELHPNQSFVVWNSFQPFEEQWLGKFDLVHVRLLASVIGPGEWEDLARNLMTMLKPGGYIQWNEENFFDLFRPPFRPGPTRIDSPSIEETNMSRMIFTCAEQLKDTEFKKIRHVEGLLELPDIFRKIKLDNVLLDIVSSDRVPETRKVFTWTTVRAMYSMMLSMTKTPGASLTEQDVQRLSDGADAEMEQGLYVQSGLRIYIGRKPL